MAKNKMENLGPYEIRIPDLGEIYGITVVGHNETDSEVKLHIHSYEGVLVKTIDTYGGDILFDIDTKDGFSFNWCGLGWSPNGNDDEACGENNTPGLTEDEHLQIIRRSDNHLEVRWNKTFKKLEYRLSGVEAHCQECSELIDFESEFDGYCKECYEKFEK